MFDRHAVVAHLEDDVDHDVEAGGDDEGDGEDGLVAPPHLEDQG